MGPSGAVHGRPLADQLPFNALELMGVLVPPSHTAPYLRSWNRSRYHLPERLGQLQENLLKFEKMVHCFLKSSDESSEVPFLLSLVLAFGNYLNGGKNEKRLGRADGFHVELLGRPGGLDLVNDAQGRRLKGLKGFESYQTQETSAS